MFLFVLCDFNQIFYFLICHFLENPIWSPSGKDFPQKCHLWVKKYESSKIMVILKGDTFEKKCHLMSPSVIFDPKKSNSQLIWRFWKVTLFPQLKSELFYNPYYFKIIKMHFSFFTRVKEWYYAYFMSH